jgi:hypothetical protein
MADDVTTRDNFFLLRLLIKTADADAAPWTCGGIHCAAHIRQMHGKAIKNFRASLERAYPHRKP